jgi:hypothetical protein
LKRLGAVVIVLAALSFVACGENRVERGLAPADEESTPQSAAEMQKTEEQRQQEVVREEQQKEIEEFDEAQKPPAP